MATLRETSLERPCMNIKVLYENVFDKCHFSCNLTDWNIFYAKEELFLCNEKKQLKKVVNLQNIISYHNL